MAEPQRPKDKQGTEEKGGKRKHTTEPKVPTSGAEEPVSAIIDAFAEQDELEGREIGDLAIVAEGDDPEEDNYEEDSDVDQPSTDVALHPNTQQAVKNPNYVPPTARVHHPSLSRPSSEGVVPQAIETLGAPREDDSCSATGDGEDQEDDGEDEGEIFNQKGHEEDYGERSSEIGEGASQEENGAQDSDASQETEDELVLRHVVALNASKKRTDEDRFNVVSEIVRDLYDDDPEVASDKNSWKKDVQKKLRDHTQLEVTPRRLSDWIRGHGCWAGIYAKDPKVAPGFSIALELIAIDDPEKRYELAVEVYEKKLSVRQTRKRVLEITSKKVDPRLVDKLMSKIKDPRSLPLATDYEKMDEKFLENELSKRERLLLRAETSAKRDQLKACSAFLDLLEQRLSDIDL